MLYFIEFNTTISQGGELSMKILCQCNSHSLRTFLIIINMLLGFSLVGMTDHTSNDLS